MTEREECGDLASLSFCSSFKNKRQFWVAFPLPTSLSQLLRTTQQLLCAAFVLPQCQNPLEAWLLLSVVEFPCLIYSSRTEMNQHPSLTGVRGILVSLEGLTVAGTTRACWSTDSAVLNRAEGDFVMLWQQHSLQFKSEVWPVGRDHNRRGVIGKQGEVKERERQQFKKKKKTYKEWHADFYSSFMKGFIYQLDCLNVSPNKAPPTHTPPFLWFPSLILSHVLHFPARCIHSLPLNSKD